MHRLALGRMQVSVVVFCRRIGGVSIHDVRFRRPNAAVDEVRRPRCHRPYGGVRRGWGMQGLISTINKALDAERASTRVTAARGRLRTAQRAFQLVGSVMALQ